MSLVLIENGEIYTPDRFTSGSAPSILIDDEKILKVGEIDRQTVLDLGIPCERIDARGCIVMPGLIDPHAHTIGAGGENGFASRMPELTLSQIIRAGVTTIVGLLGTDTATRHLSSLHAKTSQLWEEGISSYMYTGGFELPAQTLTGSIRNDLVLIDKVIGSGEIAISDRRWVNPDPRQLAFAVTEAMQGGMMAGKAGVTHFHVGEEPQRLEILRRLLDEYHIQPGCLYITHIERSPQLIGEAVELAKRGAFVDMDTVDQNLAEHLRAYRTQDGPLDRLTVSSDSNTEGGSPEKLFSQLTACLKTADLDPELVLPLFTRNPARALKLKAKGELQAGKDGDIFVLRKQDYALIHLIARGKVLIRNGQVSVQSQVEKLAEESKET